MVKLAFVRFVRDKVYAVKTIDEILDFFPKHSDDFDRKKSYDVMWPHLRVGSFSKEDYHPANIIFLGASRDAILQKAKAQKRTHQLPHSFIHGSATVDDQLKDSNLENTSKKRKLKEISSTVSKKRMAGVLAEPDSDDLKKRKQKEISSTTVSKKGMAGVLGAELDSVALKPMSLDSPEIIERDKRLEQALAAGTRSSVFDCLQGGVELDEPKSFQLCSPLKEVAPYVKALDFPSPERSTGVDQARSTCNWQVTPKKLDQQHTRRSAVDEILSSLPSARDPVSRDYDEDTTSVSQDSYASSTTEKHRLEDKVIELRNSLSLAKRQQQDAINSLGEANEKIAVLEKLNLRLQIQCMQLEKKSDQAGGIISPVKACPKFAVTSEATENVLDVESNLSKDETPKPKGKSVPERSPSRKKVDVKESCNFKLNEELAPMIAAALNHPDTQGLQEDGAGKVHVGNNVWIAKDFFYSKVAKASVKNSIAIADLMELVWTGDDLSKRSMKAGKSPKSINSATEVRKAAATPAKREAVLAVYRGRLIHQGHTTKAHLDLAVETEGKKIMTEKFSRAGKKAKKLIFSE